MPWLVDVAVPRPLPAPLTYLLDDEGAAPGDGELVEVPLGRGRVLGMIVKAIPVASPPSQVAGHPLRRVRRRLPPAYRIAGDRRRLADWLAGYYAVPLGEVVPLFHPPAPGTRARAPRHAEAVWPAQPPVPVPTADQDRALAWVTARLEERSFGTLLLHGVTGSGKTEVYLQAIAATLARGRSALYLLPEIALTPQAAARITDRFGEVVATLHSGLSAGQRCRVHERAARGEVRVVVGPRSALFAPLRDLGLIVVDEEHETSYKQQERPRYHARAAALVRARAARACVVLGSATPDLESYRNAARGRYGLVELRDRPVGAMPPVTMVDMRAEEVADGLSGTLLGELEACLCRGRQAILFHNRRGFARSLQCAGCGEAIVCPHCDIALTVHLRPRRLLCHYCGFSRPEPAACPACGAAGSFLPGGGGTEKLELLLAAHFPGVTTLRLDQDSTRRRGSHGRILTAFARGEARVLIGTQMVAKGHHFPGVDLVGVLAADDGLTLPDFRAHERAFQLLTQVAGRTGRDRAGKVLFQAWQPEHPVLQAAAAHDYRLFAAAELAAREAAGYPPFRRLLRVGITGRKLAAVENAAVRLGEVLRKDLAGRDVAILGPAPGVFVRLQNRYRWQLLVKGSLGPEEKRWLVACCRRLVGRDRGIQAFVDVDPLGMF